MRIELTYDLRLPVWKTGALPMDHAREKLFATKSDQGIGTIDGTVQKLTPLGFEPR